MLATSLQCRNRDVAELRLYARDWDFLEARARKNAVRASHPNRICCVNSARCLPRLGRGPVLACQHPEGQLALSYGGAISTRKCVCIQPRPPVAIPPCETVLRRPQRPGTRDACTLWEPLGSSPSGKLPQNQPYAITGSASFTPAVFALSNILELVAMKNHGHAVQNLWTMAVPCGR